ncbi:hypothetical protein IB286_13910 [Spongiibacter sp. KMU-158]|uniref:Uncharacterized protein n=1 Tax=Spongiibacter pelagi TaxID=2760804 RepID=A0A927C5T0_9GAMM|nr:hypothetical protein [Spongiibacter pelagi]MBD2860096.1 hypothetical protein [Spongiibacter pelagi]
MKTLNENLFPVAIAESENYQDLRTRSPYMEFYEFMFSLSDKELAQVGESLKVKINDYLEGKRGVPFSLLMLKEAIAHQGSIRHGELDILFHVDAWVESWCDEYSDFDGQLSGDFITSESLIDLVGVLKRPVH